MGDNVTRFPRREPMLWICGCGCSTFELLSDGGARCAACGLDQEGPGSGWLDRSEDRRTAFTEGETFRDVQGNGSQDFVRRRVALLAGGDDVALIAVARNCGTVTLWSAAETQEQEAWAKDKLQQAIALIERRGAGDGAD